MRRLTLIALAVLAVFQPLLGLPLLLLYLARSYVFAHLILLKDLKCDLLTAAAMAASFLVAAFLSHGLVKAVALALWLIALTLAPTAPRAARFMSIVIIPLPLNLPLKPLFIALFLAIAYLSTRREACGYICQKGVPHLDNVGFIPDLGVYCVFGKGGASAGTLALKRGNRYFYCRRHICRVITRDDFERKVGALHLYAPPPSCEDFRGLIYVHAPPGLVLRCISRCFNDGVIALSNIDAMTAPLASISKIDPELVSRIFQEYFKLDLAQWRLLRGALSTRSIEELTRWSSQYEWLGIVTELWSGGEEPSGWVKSSRPGVMGILDSLLYAAYRGIPILTESRELAHIAARLGLTVFLLSDIRTGNFIAIGPMSVESPLGEITVEYGQMIAYLNGEIYTDICS